MTLLNQRSNITLMKEPGRAIGRAYVYDSLVLFHTRSLDFSSTDVAPLDKREEVREHHLDIIYLITFGTSASESEISALRL